MILKQSLRAVWLKGRLVNCRKKGSCRVFWWVNWWNLCGSNQKAAQEHWELLVVGIPENAVPVFEAELEKKIGSSQKRPILLVVR